MQLPIISYNNHHQLNNMKLKTLGYMPCYVGSSIAPFDTIFDKAVDITQHGMNGVDAILLWGGTDIHPSYYGEKPHKQNQVAYSEAPSSRDVAEWKAMIWAKANGIPIIGVCRGAQFLTAFAGGRLIQHVNGHGGGTHPVLCKVDDGEVYHHTTTCHHQMMYPFGVEHEMLAWCNHSLSTVYEQGPGAKALDMRNRVEPEVVYYPNVLGLGIQGHPEWMNATDPFVVWCMELINKKFFEEVTQ